MIIRKFEKNPDLFFWSCLGLIVILSSASLFLNINGSLKIDEPFSANLMNLSWAEFFKVFLHDPATPLYYVLLKLWTSIFGDSERALRSFSVLCFVLTVVLVGITAREMGGLYAGLAGAILASTSSVGRVFADTARPYAVLSLLVAIGAFLFFYLAGFIKAERISGGRQIFPLVGFVMINTLGVLTHPIYIFFLLGCNAAALIKSRKLFWTISLCNVLTAVFFLVAWGSFFFRTIDLPAVSWMEIPDIKDLIHGYLNVWGILFTLLLLGYLILASIWNFKSVKDFVLSQAGLMCLILLTTMSLVPFLISQNRSIFNDERTPALFFPLACVFVALLVTRFKNLWFTFGLLMILFGVVVVFPFFKNGSTVERSPRSSIAYVVQNAKCGDIIIAAGLSINETSYYMRRLNAPACIQMVAFPASMEEHPGWMYPPDLLMQPETLAAEADDLVNHTENELRTENRIWLFYEDRTDRKDVLDILKSRLDQKLVLTESIKGYGSFFTEVLVYSKK
jgi:hypothetical protein